MAIGEKLNAERRRQHSHGDRGNDNKIVAAAPGNVFYLQADSEAISDK